MNGGLLDEWLLLTGLLAAPLLRCLFDRAFFHVSMSLSVSSPVCLAHELQGSLWHLV